MTVWTRAAIMPSATIRGRSVEGRRLRAFALLLEGRQREYVEIAESLRLPASIDDLPQSSVGQLFASLLAVGEDESVAMNYLAELLATKDLDVEVGAIAAVLLAMLQSGIGRPDVALSTLRGWTEQQTDVLTTALLQLHVGLRASEMGQTKEALEHTQAAETHVRSRRGPEAYTIGLVASINAMQFAWLMGNYVRAERRSVHRSPLFGWIFGGSDDALSGYLDETFTSYFDDPHTRTVKFAVEDAIDVGISQSLLRCEVVAYRQGITEHRRKLGRYRLLTESGQSGSMASTGFELLRRAGDDKGLRLAARTTRVSGPLEVLRAVGIRAATASWLEAELKATLEVLAISAFTFDADHAALVFDRLIQALPDVVTKRYAGAWIVDSGLRALGAVLPLVDRERTATASKWLRQLGSQHQSPLLHQSLSRALHGLSWSQLEEAERQGWLEFVSSFIGTTDDRVFPAQAAALELAGSGSDEARRLIYEAHRAGQSGWLTPLVLGMGEFDDEARLRIGADARRAATRLRESANRGEYRLGALNTGATLATAAVKFGDRGLWRELGKFLFDPRVPLDERMAAANVLLQDPSPVGLTLRRRLARGLPEPEMFLPLGGDPAGLGLVNLRLRAAFGRLPPSDALSTLLRSASDASSSLRISAAVTAGELAFRAPIPIGTLLLSLSHDRVPEVRGAAGRALAQARFEAAELEQTRATRISELLQEPGEVVPIQVWRGIEAAVRRRSLPVDEDVRRLATHVAGRHIANTVRAAAQSALDAMAS